MARTLYYAYDLLHDPRYRGAADRYAVFFIACVYDTAPAFALGSALEPCLKLYKEYNQWDESLESLYYTESNREVMDGKAKAVYRWLLIYRTDNGNYINCGYPWYDEIGLAHSGEDVGYSCDLTDVGRGLLAYYELIGDEQALADAVGLAHYYIRHHKPGTLEGVWSDELGTWLIGPRHVAGFENLSDVYADEAGWVFTTYYASLFLARLHDRIEDETLRGRLRERCVRSLRWTFDACQFEDGAVGLHGRDDKWLGATAMAILQYVELQSRLMLDRDTHRAYYDKALKALGWLREMSSPDRYPPDGYVPVTGVSKPWPPWNTPWLMALTAEALMRRRELRSFGTP